MTTEECMLLMNLSLATNKEEALDAIKKLHPDETPEEWQRMLKDWLEEGQRMLKDWLEER